MTTSKIILNIEQRAKSKKVSIKDLCAAANIARSTYQRWKSGKTSPTLRVLSRIEDALDRLESVS